MTDVRRIAQHGLLSFIMLLTATVAANADGGGSSQLHWKISPMLTVTVTPNYQSGFGPQGGAGSNQTVAAGPLAALGTGYVDFGNVTAGFQYLYKYAAQISVTTNDPAGFTVYAEGSTDFVGTPSSTWPISTTLFWLPSSTANNPYTPATPFNKTSGTPTGTPSGSTIQYTGAPPPSAIVWNYPTSGPATQGYDYELILADGIPTNQFDVYIVYTTIAN